MITIILLAIIYIAFISLGLPDTLLGVAWPAIRGDFSMSLDSAGIISIITVGMTVVSSMANGYLVEKLGTGKITLISCLMTGSALLAISIAPSFWWLVIISAIMGLGAGSVDASLNNYVAQHFKAHHMNWLHSFWGVGATMGPVIMGKFLMSNSWRLGYQMIGILQLIFAFVLLLTLPLWQKHHKVASETGLDGTMEKSVPKPLKLKGVKSSMLALFFYVAIEMSVALWGSTYLTQVMGVGIGQAARWIALYFSGITVGRFVSGFVSFKLSNRQLIRLGIGLALTGSFLVLSQISHGVMIFGYVLIGAGFAPIFPSMLHETPILFGKSNAGKIMGFQMAAAYTGGAIIPPILGFLYESINLGLYPVMTVILVVIIGIMTERTWKVSAKQ